MTTRIMGGAMALLGILCLYLYVSNLRLSAANARLQTTVVAATAAIRSYNSATDQQRRDTLRREAEQGQLLADARRQNETIASAIERLRRSSVTVRTDAPCTISPALREATGL